MQQKLKCMKKQLSSFAPKQMGEQRSVELKGNGSPSVDVSSKMLVNVAGGPL